MVPVNSYNLVCADVINVDQQRIDSQKDSMRHSRFYIPIGKREAEWEAQTIKKTAAFTENLISDQRNNIQKLWAVHQSPSYVQILTC